VTETLADAALGYLRAGLHILALSGKKPNPKWHESWDWDNSIHGNPATEEEWEQIGSIFNRGSTTGIAILIPKDVLVADVDTEEAAALYMELAGAYPDTPTARTKNGLHVWFWHPGADASVWIGGRTLLFKGFGGYVVAPPSAHYDEAGQRDGTYEWLVPLTNEHDTVGPIDFLPKAMGDRLIIVEALSDDEGKAPKEHWRIRYETVGDSWRLWKEWDLEGLRRTIITAPEGNQNNIIAWAALTAQEEGVSFDDAMKHLYSAAIEGGHPPDRAKATIRGVYKRRSRG